MSYYAIRDEGALTVAIVGGPFDTADEASAVARQAADDDLLDREHMVSVDGALELSVLLSGASVEDARPQEASR